MQTMLYYIITRKSFKLKDICRAHGTTPLGTENLFEVEVECGDFTTISEIDTCPGTVGMNGVLRPYSVKALSLIHISEPTRLLSISYAVFCLKKKKTQHKH
eukprot:TRINITY_DN18158_c0_g1_i1.p1 TRINITY_DN18158_c0_g1~~TRINITY_DN18158_c0_g1_i1.p1  ORF type:complete len:101 (+),score=6.18 TRINITY_DN18158_c0_g1_i1:192-494(+)